MRQRSNALQRFAHNPTTKNPLLAVDNTPAALLTTRTGLTSDIYFNAEKLTALENFGLLRIGKRYKSVSCCQTND